MLDFLDEVASSRHFFHDDLARLEDLLAAAQRLELQSDITNALINAVDALRHKQLDGALEFLLYAQRLAPYDKLITLFVGDLRLALGRPEAAEPFSLIASHCDWRGAWYRLAVTRARTRNYLQAAADLHETLSRNAPLHDRITCEFSSEVANLSSSLGWCGLNNAGKLFVGGEASTFRTGDLRVELDGVPQKLFDRRNVKDMTLSQFLLGVGWQNGSLLKVTAKGLPLIGGSISIRSITRTEGFVQTNHERVEGWIWFPGEPNLHPTVRIDDLDFNSPPRILSADRIETLKKNVSNLALPRSFSISFNDLPQGRIQVRGPYKKTLYGSPLNPWGTIRSGMASAQRLTRRFPAIGQPEIADDDVAAEVTIPAIHHGIRTSPSSDAEKVTRNILVVIPVFRGYDATMNCVKSVLAHKSSREEILVISDASPEETLVLELRKVARRKKIGLRLERQNRGFPGTANLGLRLAAEKEQDVILLNSDTIVTAGWTERLQEAAHQSDNIGTVTPFSNSATILSYPVPDKANKIPSLDEIEELSNICAAANSGIVVDIPTANGFCMFIKHECLVETGIFRDETFAQGYGEENDFCLRARHLGWRHVALPSLYIGHIEGQSFAAAKDNLVSRNLKILNSLHPGYDALIAEWQKANPLAEYRRRIDKFRWRSNQGSKQAILYVTHDREGGVLHHVQMRALKHEKDGLCAIICRPGVDRHGLRYCELVSPVQEFPNLRFQIGTELGLLRTFLAQRDLAFVEVHHFIGHDQAVIFMIRQLGIPYNVHIHDYSWFCPRITLTATGNRYCGEPHINECIECEKDLGSNLGFSISPPELFLQSAELFSGARAIVAPSEDTARRFRSRFNIKPQVIPWEDESTILQLQVIRALAPGAIRKVCIAGAIGYEKGYDVILACARYAATRNLPLEFVVVGFTCNDESLLRTGKVRITGQYEDHEAVKLIKDQNADFAFLPALWPETWSYVLSQLWRAELPVVAFDIGAPSERIKARYGGFVLPLGLPVDRIVQWFLSVGVANLQ